MDYKTFLQKKKIETDFSAIPTGDNDIIDGSKIIFGLPGTKHTFLNTHKSNSIFEPSEKTEFEQMMNSPKVKEDPLEGLIDLRGFYQDKIKKLSPGQKSIDYERDSHATVSSVVEDFWLKFPREFLYKPKYEWRESSLSYVNLQIKRYKKLLKVCKEENFSVPSIHKGANLVDNQIFFRHNAFIKLEQYPKKSEEFLKTLKEFERLNEVDNPLQDQSQQVRPKLRIAIEEIQKVNTQAPHSTNAELYLEVSKRELCRLKALINKIAEKAEDTMVYDDYPELQKQISTYVDSSILADFFSSRAQIMGPNEFSYRPTREEANNWVFNVSGIIDPDKLIKVQKITKESNYTSRNNMYDPTLFDIFTNPKVSAERKSAQRAAYIKGEKTAHIKKLLEAKKKESKPEGISSEIKSNPREDYLKNRKNFEKKNEDSKFTPGGGQPNPSNYKSASRQYSTKKPEFEKRSELDLDFGTIFVDYNINFIFVIFVIGYFIWLNNQLKKYLFYSKLFFIK